MTRSLAGALAFLSLAGLARAAIEFTGVLGTREKTLFVLTDTVTQKTAWLVLNGSFAGHMLTAYDAKEDVITLTKGGTETRVRLKDAHIKAARLELTGTIRFGTGEKLEIVRAALRFDQENVFPLKDGLTYRITPKRLPDGTIHFALAIEQDLPDGRSHTMSAPKVLVLPDREFALQIGDFAFSFTPKAP